MNELSLFSGAGGGLLGTKLLGWKTIGYVEKDPYCQEVLKARIKDGCLDAAPIFGDIKRFVAEGYGFSYRGLVDVVTAGFPCQPFSVAGKRKGKDDERNMWPETIRVIHAVRPKYCLLENVPGLLNSGFFGTVLGSLAEAGYDAEWAVLGASDVGANHRRKRLWILAYDNQIRRDVWESEGKGIYGNETRNEADSGGEVLADTGQPGLQESTRPKFKSIREPKEPSSRSEFGGRTSAQGEWWSVEPRLDRVAHGVANRVDRLKAIGNGQVPAVAKTIWGLLNDN